MSCFCVTRARTTKIWIFCWSFFIASHLFVFSSFFQIFFYERFESLSSSFFSCIFFALPIHQNRFWRQTGLNVEQFLIQLFIKAVETSISSCCCFPVIFYFQPVPIFFLFFFSWFVLRGTSGSGVVCSNCLAIPLCPFIARNWTLSPLI